ncbi:MAG: hypothetical protein NWE98_01565 [Candidatus Bathyarchaeota archaeon]|nr:hypothetical protein [Candidatus Bathyarchaeota archaeon]
MHRKAVFALAGVFLTVALIVPPILFKIQADQDLDNLIVLRDNPGMETSGNITIAERTNENHQKTLITVAVIETIFVILFTVTLYYGINHPPTKR